jgi:glutaredoxin
VAALKVKIFVSDHCVFCQEAVRYFHEKGVPLEEINVSHDQNRFDEMLRLGGIATPLIVIGEQIFHSFDRIKIEHLLEGKDE